jgi:hypothetical protein
MGWRNVIRIWWFEPYKFRFLTRAERVRAFWHKFPIAAAAFSANFLAVWLLYYLLAWLDPTRKVLDFPHALSFIVIGGPVCACLACAEDYLPLRMIVFGEVAGVHSRGRYRQRWHYDQIAYVCFDTMPEGTGAVRVMLIVPRDGQNVVVGVPKRLKLAKLTDFLKSKGVEIVEKPGVASDGGAEA